MKEFIPWSPSWLIPQVLPPFHPNRACLRTLSLFLLKLYLQFSYFIHYVYKGKVSYSFHIPRNILVCFLDLVQLNQTSWYSGQAKYRAQIHRRGQKQGRSTNALNKFSVFTWWRNSEQGKETFLLLLIQMSTGNRMSTSLNLKTMHLLEQDDPVKSSLNNINCYA